MHYTAHVTVISHMLLLELFLTLFTVTVAEYVHYENALPTYVLFY